MSDEQVLRRNNMSQKKKTRNAIKVLQSIVEAGEVDKLYRDFHMTLKSAREETVCHPTYRFGIFKKLTLIFSREMVDDMLGLPISSTHLFGLW